MFLLRPNVSCIHRIICPFLTSTDLLLLIEYKSKYFPSFSILNLIGVCVCLFCKENLIQRHQLLTCSHFCRGRKTCIVLNHIHVYYCSVISLLIYHLPIGYSKLTNCGRVAQICVFNTVKLGTSASSP